MTIQFDATARRWHVITGDNLVTVLYAADSEQACEAWLATEQEGKGK